MEMMVGSHVPPPPPESVLSQILSMTFEAEMVCLGSKQLIELKALASEYDKQRSRAM